MNDALIKQWRELAAQARQWQAGGDPAPVLEALALSVALELTGDLARVPPGERDALRKTGQRALLFVGAPVLADAGAALDEDDLEALRLSAAIARDGLHALSSRAASAERRRFSERHVSSERDISSERERSRRATEPEDRVESPSAVRGTIPPGDLVRLLRGQLDGLAAGSLAMRIRRSDAALGELEALARLSRPEERPLALAAADPAAVLDPAGGRVIGTLQGLGAEAVLFEGAPRRLAVYSEDPYPLRLIAPELTTEDVREGYWIGRVEEGATRVEAALHVGSRGEGDRGEGDRVERWVLDLS